MKHRGDFMKHLMEWFTGGGMIALFGLIWRSNYINDEKIGKVYSRFDKYKDNVKNDYVGKDVCEVINEQTKVQYLEIKDTLKGIHKKLDAIRDSR